MQDKVSGKGLADDSIYGDIGEYTAGAAGGAAAGAGAAGRRGGTRRDERPRTYFDKPLEKDRDEGMHGHEPCITCSQPFISCSLQDYTGIRFITGVHTVFIRRGTRTLAYAGTFNSLSKRRNIRDVLQFCDRFYRGVVSSRSVPRSFGFVLIYCVRRTRREWP